MATSSSLDKAAWTKRIDRATELAERNPWAREVLIFYVRILEFQSVVYESTQLQDEGAVAIKAGLRGRLNVDAAARSFPELVAVVQKNAPPKLAEDAVRLRDSSRDHIREILEHWLATPDPPQDGSSFFARVLLQPQAERLAQAGELKLQRLAENKCPVCQSNPQLAVIRPEGYGGKRSLLCSFCQTEWDFRRILCPACGEENNDNLPRYSAEGVTAVRVEACDTCQHYIKSVDMTVNGLAVPVVDEIATAPLDLWAAEHDYRKIQLNIMGL